MNSLKRTAIRSDQILLEFREAKKKRCGPPVGAKVSIPAPVPTDVICIADGSTESDTACPGFSDLVDYCSASESDEQPSTTLKASPTIKLDLKKPKSLQPMKDLPLSAKRTGDTPVPPLTGKAVYASASKTIERDIRKLFVECFGNPEHAFFTGVKEEATSLVEDIMTALDIEQCTVWSLPQFYTPLISSYFFSVAKVSLKKQARRKKDAFGATGNLELYQTAYITRSLDVASPLQYQQIQNVRATSILKLAKRYGGLPDLLRQTDDSARFVILSILCFDLKVADLEAAYAKFPYALSLKFCECNRDLKNTIKAAACLSMWKLPEKDTELIAKRLFLKFSLIIKKQAAMDNNVTGDDAGTGLLGHKIMTGKGKSVMRRRVLTECGLLADRCGGLFKLKLRGPFCAKFLDLAIATYDLNAEDLEKAVAKCAARANGPEYAPLKVACDEFEALREKVDVARAKDQVKKMWAISDTSLLGQYLFAQVIYEAETQKYRRKMISSRGQDTRKWDGKIIARNLQPANPSAAECQRRQSFGLCVKIVKKCGGVEKLIERKDDCGRFLSAAMALYDFKLADISADVFGSPVSNAARKNAATGASSAHAFPDKTRKGGSKMELARTRREMNAVIQLMNSGTKLWQQQDSDLIGRFLYTRLRNEVAMQEYRLDRVRERGDDLEKWRGILISKDLAPLPHSVGLDLRNRAKNECVKLAERFGGMRHLLAQSPICREYIRLAVTLFGFKLSEMPVDGQTDTIAC